MSNSREHRAFEQNYRPFGAFSSAFASQAGSSLPLTWIFVKVIPLSQPPPIQKPE
jgi:hypothetical protein